MPAPGSHPPRGRRIRRSRQAGPRRAAPGGASGTSRATHPPGAPSTPPAPSGLCLATVATESFLPGALVLLASFLQHHPRFHGDLVILHDALPQSARDTLRAVSPRVRFEPVSPALKHRLARLRDTHPAFTYGLEYFYSLEAFRLHGYRKVLFYDSDVLVRAPLDALFDAPDPLLCCPDHATLHGARRHARTFEPLAPDSPTDAPALSHTFNSGFLLFDGRLTRGACYADLLDMVSPHT